MPVSDDVLNAMRQTNDRFDSEVVQKKQFDVLEKVYTSDARVLPPGAEMISGYESIKAFWRQAVEAMDVKSARLSTVHAETFGDRVIEIGSADLRLGNGSTVTVKYVVYWKQEGGLWKWAVDIWNTNS